MSLKNALESGWAQMFNNYKVFMRLGLYQTIFALSQSYEFNHNYHHIRQQLYHISRRGPADLYMWAENDSNKW